MPFVVLTNTQLVLIQNYIHLQPLREKDKKKNIFFKEEEYFLKKKKQKHKRNKNSKQ